MTILDLLLRANSIGPLRMKLKLHDASANLCPIKGKGDAASARPREVASLERSAMIECSLFRLKNTAANPTHSQRPQLARSKRRRRRSVLEHVRVPHMPAVAVGRERRTARPPRRPAAPRLAHDDDEELDFALGKYSAAHNRHHITWEGLATAVACGLPSHGRARGAGASNLVCLWFS